MQAITVIAVRPPGAPCWWPTRTAADVLIRERDRMISMP